MPRLGLAAGRRWHNFCKRGPVIELRHGSRPKRPRRLPCPTLVHLIARQKLPIASGKNCRITRQRYHLMQVVLSSCAYKHFGARRVTIFAHFVRQSTDTNSKSLRRLNTMPVELFQCGLDQLAFHFT